MPHKLIPTEKLHFQDGYNVIRSPKEFKENTADVEKQMEQLGDAPEHFPVNFVTVDGTLYTRNHATLAAAQNRKWEKIYAMESPHTPGSAADFLDLILSNNRGHAVTRLKQGEVYKMLRDGEGPGPEEIAACKTGEEPKNKRDPMTLDEIAKACSPVYSAQHIGHCLLLADSSPEVRNLIEEQRTAECPVADNVVIKAAQMSKDKKSEDVNPSKQLRIIKAAIKEATTEGAKKVTEKHLNAVKSQFVKLKAAGGDENKDKNTSTEASSSLSVPSKDEKKGDGAETLPAGNSEQEREESELFPEAAHVLTPGDKKNTKLIAALATFLTDDKAIEKLDITMTLTPDEAEKLAEEIVKIVANAAEVF